MAQLVFEIKNQWISRTDTFKPVAKSKNYLYAQFNFLTDEWVGVPTAIFRNKTSAYEQIIGQDGTCLVPWEVIDVEGDSEIFVSVFCGDLVTANKARVHVYDTGYGDDLESDTPPTPSVYEQILNRMDDIEEDMDDATRRAETAAENAEEASSHYPVILEEYWYVWDVIEHEYVDTNIKAEAHDGTSATVEVEQIVGGHRVIITDVSGEHVFDVPDGRDGTDGRGIASLEKTSTSGDVDQYTMTFSDDSEPFVYYVTNGASATISTRAITNGYRLTITDKNGTRAIDVLNGAKGDPGNGIQSINKIGSYENYDYYEIRMTNGNKTSFTVTNGYSPTVSTVSLTGGHRVIITDANGSHSFDVMDGNGITNTVLNSDYTLTITFTDGTSYTTPSIRGTKGDTGNGIQSIAKTGTSGLVDTYTITYTNGQTTTFDVTNGETPTVDAGDVPYDDTEIYPNGSVGDGLSSLKAEINHLMPETNDLSQWLFAENKYYNSSFELTDLQGYNTYKIPCDTADCVVISWNGNTEPWGTLNRNYTWVYENSNGLSRDLTSKNYNRYTTGKRVWFIAPSGTKAFYLTFLSERLSDVKIIKNTPRKHDKCVDIADNFIVPINGDTAIDANAYFSGSLTINAWTNVDYHTWWIHVKKGNVLKFNSAVEGLTYNAQIYYADDTIARTVSDLTITFSADATVIIFEKATTHNNAILIPQGAKLGIDAENVIGLADKIADVIAPISAEVDEVDGRVDNIELKLSATDIVYSTGDTNGYYRVVNDAIEMASSSSFSCSIVEVTDAMMSVAFEIKSVSGISYNIIYCGFADANHRFISKVDVAVGVYDLGIPSNAKYIYLSFFGATYNSNYTIKVNGLVTKSDINRLGIVNGFDGLSGVAFGTSLTYRAQTTGGYLQYLPDMSGMTIDNQGVGSSYIYGNGGAIDMLAKIKSYASYSDKDICLFEGFVNDWYYNKTLGTYTDTTETSVCGCVRSAINYMLSQNANLTIFLILDPYGRNYNNLDCSSSAVNSSGLTQYAFYEEVAKVGESLGIPVIKMYAESQISQNTPQYILDNIHPNALGAKQSANFIWSKIKQYYPNA